MLTILNNGLRIQDNSLYYAWFDLQDGEKRFFRALALKELAAIPVSVREDYDLLGKQWAAMRGLHNASVNFVYTAMGIFDPEHIGVVQYFGAVAEGPNEDAAAEQAIEGLVTVESVLANFPQSKLSSPTPEWFRWYLDFVTSRGRFLAAILGHPDPRQGKRGDAGDGSVGDDSDSDLAEEQNEILFRGLAKLRQNFVFQVLAEHVSRDHATDALIRVAQAASIVASRRKGSMGIGFSLGIPLMAAINQGVSGMQSSGTGASQGTSDGVSHGWGDSHQIGQAHSVSNGVTETVGKSTGHSWGSSESVTDSQTVTDSTMQSHSEGESKGINFGANLGGNLGASVGLGIFDTGVRVQGGQSIGVSAGISHGWSWADSWGVGHAESIGHSETKGSFESFSESEMQSKSISHSETLTDSESWGQQQSWGESQSVSAARSQMQNIGLSRNLASGFSTGVVPGININRTWQTEDDVAERVTEILRKLEGLLNMASAEGGFMTNAFIFTDSRQGASAADALVPQAFHGPNVPTPVLTVHPAPDDEKSLRTHAFAFCPWRGADDGDPFGGDLWTRYATLLTAGQLAALTAPGLFEEGSATTVMAPIPKGMAFYPRMSGDVVLGHQYSPETADLTTAQIRISQDNLMHTMFAGDTGFGKSVAAIRMAYETTLRWKLRTVVLDFGAGWRSLLNAPGMKSKVDILQLWPDAVRPMRWNPLQIGRNLAPETQWRAFADVFGGIAQLGVKRQKQEMLEALRRIYLRAGVLIDDPEVRGHARWGRVQSDETNLLGVTINMPLSSLTSAQRQALAVQRSSVVGLADLYEEVDVKLQSIPPRDTMLTGVLEGILFRLNPLVQGSAAVQFAPGKDTVPVEDFSKPWGTTIIEGGMFLDDFGKAFLLGWTGWHLYMDMVSRRVHEVNTGEPLLQIFFEEANKIFIQNKGSEDESTGVSAAQRFADMFRDARKYKARLHPITQAPSLIPQDIISSCNNLVVGFLKQPKDKDLVLSALARSEKGFRDEEWRRFVDDIPIGMVIGRFPYTMEREAQRPVLFRPLMLDVPEPTDEEIEKQLGRISL